MCLLHGLYSVVVCVITATDVDKTTAAMTKHSTRDACNHVHVAGRKSRERREKAGRGERKGGG